MVDSDNSALSEGERALFEAFNELGVRYLIVGLSAALVQGARVSTEDIDLWFGELGDPKIGQAAARAGGVWVTRSQRPLLGGASMSDRLDVVTHMDGLASFDEEYLGAKRVRIDGVDVLVLPLERIIESKRVANRAKDRSVLFALEEALAVGAALARALDPDE